MRRNRPEYSDGVMKKANDYIGHPREVDEGYEVARCRTAYAEGYVTAMENAIKFIEDNIFDYPWYDSESDFSATDIANDLRKTLEG
jgi:hypothetical protein